MGQPLVRDAPLSLPLDGRTLSVGRDPGCDVVLSGVGVSRRHAAIALTPGGPTIRDCGSSFGLRVDGAPSAQATLVHGTRLTIGVVRIAVSVTGQALGLAVEYERAAAQAAAVQPRGETRRIGRSADSDLRCDHPLVSRRHATLQRDASGALTITDHQSANGTFVNGRRVRRAELAPGDIVQVGPYRFLLEQGQLVPADDAGRVRLEASAVSVRRGGRAIVDNVTLAVEPGEFVAVLGPSGAGKSTLAYALTGQLTPDEGEVYINAMPLRQFAAAFSSSIGFVSQQNLLPLELTVAEILAEQAVLRLPADSGPAERGLRIDEVLELLELRQVAAKQARTLSGGEARRVHLAIELLASPALIFLDEPLAGLDFGLIRSFMALFRRIADRGHTLLLTTHTLEQLDLCDRIFFLNRGALVYDGKAAAAREAFGVESLAQVYEKVKREGITRLQAPSATTAVAPQAERPAPMPLLRPPRRAGASFARQLLLLVVRYSRIFVRDWRNLALVLLQAPLIALMLAAVYGPSIDFLPLSFYFAATIAAVWIGGVNTVREVAREWPMFFREYRAGLSLAAYLAAKVLVFGVLSALQGLLFALCLDGCFTQFSLRLDNALLLVCAAAGGAMLGLCISALSAGVNRAMSLLPVVFIPQIVFAGALMPFDRMPRLGEWISLLTVSRPVFTLLKRTQVLGQGLWLAGEWRALGLLLAGVTILAGAGLAWRLRRLARGVE